jgi:hypothetical protein
MMWVVPQAVRASINRAPSARSKINLRFPCSKRFIDLLLATLLNQAAALHPLHYETNKLYEATDEAQVTHSTFG